MRFFGFLLDRYSVCGHVAFPLQYSAIWSNHNAGLVNASRISGREAAGRNIFHYDAARRHDRSVTYMDAGKDNCVCTDQAALADPRIEMHVIKVVVSQNGSAKSDSRISSYVNSTRITFIKSRLIRDDAIFTDIHSPHRIEIPTAQASRIISSQSSYNYQKGSGHGQSQERENGVARIRPHALNANEATRVDYASIAHQIQGACRRCGWL